MARLNARNPATALTVNRAQRIVAGKYDAPENTPSLDVTPAVRWLQRRFGLPLLIAVVVADAAGLGRAAQ